MATFFLASLCDGMKYSGSLRCKTLCALQRERSIVVSSNCDAEVGIIAEFRYPEISKDREISSRMFAMMVYIDLRWFRSFYDALWCFAKKVARLPPPFMIPWGVLWFGLMARLRGVGGRGFLTTTNALTRWIMSPCFGDSIWGFRRGGL